jgi:NADP-dependent aldehyde dehydrogenase
LHAGKHELSVTSEGLPLNTLPVEPFFSSADAACRRAARTFAADRSAPLPSAARAGLLRSIADALEARREAVIAQAASETALTPDELAPEFRRMVETFRLFAGLVAEGSWVRASVDTPVGKGAPAAIGPNHDVRSMFQPLGPVAVFGASNFPLAYGVCGGDTASALAAGCPVIVKEHPAHPRTGRLLAEIVHGAISAPTKQRHASLTHTEPPLWLAYLFNQDERDLAPAQALVTQPEIAAVGFTGSIPGGVAVSRLAAQRPRPIPVFAEMGSNNMVAVTRSALHARGVAIAHELADSILARFGQQCTCIGLVLLDAAADSAARSAFTTALRDRLAGAPPRDMLSAKVRDTYVRRLEEAARAARNQQEEAGTPPAVSTDRRAAARLIEIEPFGPDRLFDPRLREEIFGPACVLASADLADAAFIDGLLNPAGHPGDSSETRVSTGDSWGRGALVASIYLESPPAPHELRLAERVGRSVGRLAFNSVTTGVRVCRSMVHSGPYPACSRPESTAVGHLAIERWCRPVCFQNAPPELLPLQLRDDNPLAISRTINGHFSPARQSEPGAGA